MYSTKQNIIELVFFNVFNKTIHHMYLYYWQPIDVLFPIWGGCTTVMSSLARWRLKSPALWLFTQSFIKTQIKENIKTPLHGLCEVNSRANGPTILILPIQVENCYWLINLFVCVSILTTDSLIWFELHHLIAVSKVKFVLRILS